MNNSGMNNPGMSDPKATRLARVALALYPPSWRARYGDEVHALVQESGSLRDVASLAWRALPAWIWPPAHLHDRPARMRASLSTGLLAWSFLTGLGLVFAQLTQFQGFHPAGHSIIKVSYLVFDAALALSIAAAGLGGLPLWLLMLRRAYREHRRRDVAYLLLPLIAPAVFLAGLRVTVSLVGGANGVSPWWFLVVTLVGFAAATLAAAGPGLAMRRLQPRGPALRLAATAGGVAAAPSWWPRRPSSSRSPGCACGRAVSPATTTPPSRVSTWPWSWWPRPSPRSARPAAPAPRSPIGNSAQVVIRVRRAQPFRGFMFA
jgi:hypothetical protein